jgi:ATP-dependent Clp protease ATP-binding subunit ClpC
VGYEEGGQLTEAVRRKSYSVILLDEIEKAHPEAFNMLLQIMEDGNLSDAKGRKVDFRNTIIIMTSNVGADVINRDISLGFSVKTDEAKAAAREYDLMKDKVLQELKKAFRPEFLNRLDAVIVFHSLTTNHIRQITDLMLNRVRKQLGEQNIELKVTDDAMELLATRGYDHNFGARPLRRIIQNLIEDPLAEGMLEQRFQPETDVYVTVEEGLLKLNSQDEYEASQPPAKKGRKKKGEDLEPELSGAGATSEGTTKE